MNLRCATFNTGSFLARSAADSWLTLGPARYAAKLEAITTTLDRVRPDICALQEVVDRGAVESLAAALGDEYSIIAATDCGSRQTRTWLISRFPATRVEVHDDHTGLMHWKGQELPHLRSIIDAVFELRPGVEVRVLATHLKSKRAVDPTVGGELNPESFADWGIGSAFSTVKRLSQAIALRRIVDETLIQDPDARLLLMGDLNDSPNSPPLDIIIGDHEAARRTALRKTELIPVARTLPRDARFTHIYRNRKMQLDYILVSRALWRGFVRAEIQNEHLPTSSSAVQGELGESDHAPFLAEFRV